MYKIGRIRGYLILYIAALLSVTVLDHLRIFGSRPDLTLICVVFFGLFLGRTAGLEAGLFAGFVTDIFSLDYFGINMITYGMSGLVAGMLSISFIKESKRTQFLLVFACAVFSMSLHFTLASSFSRSAILGFGEYLASSIVPGSIYTALVSIPIFIKFIELYGLREREELL